MVSSSEDTFTKQAACPSAKALLDYRSNQLAFEMGMLVKWHLEVCDFCWAEFQMLEHHSPHARGDGKAPVIPVNLRVLAEALFRNSKALKRKGTPTY